MPKGIYQHKKGYKRPLRSKEWSKKISDAKKGQISPMKGVKGLFRANKTSFKKGMIPWNIGKEHLAVKGEKCHFWKGGISLITNYDKLYPNDWTETLKKAIRQRDNYTCKICGIEPAIYVHHIDYDKKNCSLDNLITLCLYCHSKTNCRRDYWINYFKKIL